MLSKEDISTLAKEDIITLVLQKLFRHYRQVTHATYSY